MLNFIDNMGKNHFLNLHLFDIIGVSDDDELPRCVATVARKGEKTEVCRLYYWLRAVELYALLPPNG